MNFYFFNDIKKKKLIVIQLQLYDFNDILKAAGTPGPGIC